jgi:hypothetical protein
MFPWQILTLPGILEAQTKPSTFGFMGKRYGSIHMGTLTGLMFTYIYQSCDLIIAKDPERTFATVSPSHLQELQKNFLSNHVLSSHRSHSEVLHLGLCPIN